MRKILKWIILAVILSVIIFMIYGLNRESNIKQGEDNTKLIEQENNSEIQDEQNQITKENEQIKELVAEEYKGYKVAANLKIEKLNIDTCVLDDYTKEAMETCVTKFFGPEPNEVGNFCITGHNYITKNMFGYLYQLDIGDSFTLTDNKNGVVEYEIYDEYRAKANQTYGLSQKTNGKREVTLVTCCNYSDDRLVIKAKEI